MAAGQKDVVQIFRSIARQHRRLLPTVLSGSLNSTVKNRIQGSLTAYAKLKQPQEKKEFEDNFYSTWNNYLAAVREKDPRKELSQVAKVVLDPTEKETLPLPSIPPYLRSTVAGLSAEKQAEYRNSLQDVAARRTELLRQEWKNNQAELSKSLSDKELKELSNVKPAKTPQEQKQKTEELIAGIQELISNEQHLDWVLPFFKLSPPVEPALPSATGLNLDQLLTPDQLKSKAKQIEELKKLSPEERKAKLRQARASLNSGLSAEQVKEWNADSLKLFLANKSPEQQKELTAQLDKMSPEERADFVESRLEWEYLPATYQHRINKLAEKVSKLPPAEREKFYREKEAEAIADFTLSAAQQPKLRFLKTQERISQALDPKGEHKAQYEKLTPEQKQEVYDRTREYSIPVAFENLAIERMADPELNKAFQTPGKFQAWLAKQVDPAKQEEDLQKFIKSLQGDSKPREQPAKH